VCVGTVWRINGDPPTDLRTVLTFSWSGGSSYRQGWKRLGSVRAARASTLFEL
jgi:hypothetical protein